MVAITSTLLTPLVQFASLRFHNLDFVNPSLNLEVYNSGMVAITTALLSPLAQFTSLWLENGCHILDFVNPSRSIYKLMTQGWSP